MNDIEQLKQAMVDANLAWMAWLDEMGVSRPLGDTPADAVLNATDAYKASLPPVKARRGLLSIEAYGFDAAYISAAPAIEGTEPVEKWLAGNVVTSAEIFEIMLEKIDIRNRHTITGVRDAVVVLQRLIASKAPAVEGK